MSDEWGPLAMIDCNPERLRTADITISIVTVSYNSAKTIAQTLKSVIDQRYPHVEHIVVDGGSTDGTPCVLRDFERQNFRWISEPDRGMYDAMNKGMALASGTCVGILNSDDWLEPDALSDVAACFASEKCDYTYGDVYLAAEEGRRFGLMEALDVNRMGQDYLYTMPFPHQSCYVRRSILDKVGPYSLEYRLSADHDFVVRLIAAGARGARLPRPIATYRMGGAGGGAATFRESRDIAIRYGMPKAKAFAKFSASLIKVWMAGSMPRPITRALMKLKGSRHVWY